MSRLLLLPLVLAALVSVQACDRGFLFDAGPTPLPSNDGVAGTDCNTLTAPTAVGATLDADSIALAWQAQANVERFSVEVSRSGVLQAPISVVGAMAYDYGPANGQSLPVDTSYTFRVTASLSGCDSLPSDPAQVWTWAVPVVVVDEDSLTDDISLEADADDLNPNAAHNVRLTWASANVQPVTYRVERQGRSEVVPALLSTSGETTTPLGYLDTTAEANERYVYTVTVVGAAGLLTTSVSAGQATLPQAPTPTWTDYRVDGVSLTWTDDHSDEVGFRITGGAAVADLAAGVTQHSLTGLAAATAYNLGVCAVLDVDAAGCAPLLVETSAQPTFVIDEGSIDVDNTCVVSIPGSAAFAGPVGFAPPVFQSAEIGTQNCLGRLAPGTADSSGGTLLFTPAVSPSDCQASYDITVADNAGGEVVATGSITLGVGRFDRGVLSPSANLDAPNMVGRQPIGPEVVGSLGCPGGCGPATDRPASIAAGIEHTCVVGGDTRVYCWGRDTRGELGNGTVGTTSISNPGEVCLTGSPPSSCTPLTGAVAVVTGGDTSLVHTCALMDDQTVWCWGSGETGQLGSGNTEAGGYTASNPVRVCAGGFWNGTACSGGAPLSDIVGLAAGDRHTCALDESGEVWCWGSCSQGELGHGFQVAACERAAPVPVCASGSVDGGTCVRLTGVVGISAGGQHSCALLDSGQVRCWGRNSTHELGDINLAAGFSTALVTVMNGGSPLDDVRAISSGPLHACALRNSAGQVWCWGNDSLQQLGDADPDTDDAAPGPVCAPGGGCTPIDNIVSISAGHRHNCALAADGQLRCWGEGGAGALGGSNTSNQSTATLVCVGSITCNPLGDHIAVSAGYRHTCALWRAPGSLAAPQARCWGDQAFGRLGNGTTSAATMLAAQSVCAAGTSTSPTACTSSVFDEIQAERCASYQVSVP